jgi:thioredoxin-related protein
MYIKNAVKCLIWLFVLSASFAQAKVEGSLSEGMVNPGHEQKPAWFKNSFLDISEDIAEAKESGKRLMLYFYQDGCPYCKKLLEDNFGQRKIAEKTQQNFDVVSINIWGDKEVSLGDEELTEKKFAEKLKIMYTPTLIFFNEQGKAVLRTNGYYHPEKFNAALDYVLKHLDKKEKFNAYLNRISPAPALGTIHQEVATKVAPYDFEKKPNNADYHLVMFEQKQCKTCDELHKDILLREESKKLIKSFDVAVLDMWSNEQITNPAGERLSIKDWARQLGVQYAPSQIYFDKNGKEVFRVDGYLKAFHVQSVMAYVASSAYKTETNFQRYIDKRADDLKEMGVEVDLMK